MYKFPSVTAVDPVTGKPTKTNCTGCKDANGNPLRDDDGTRCCRPASTWSR